MCSHYIAMKKEAMRRYQRPLPEFSYSEDCFPERIGPFLANAMTDEWLPGEFGLVSHWSRPHAGRHTYNARSGTVATKPSFKTVWKNRQLCVIPVQAFYEPRYEPDGAKSVPWRIERQDGQPFGLAGIWDRFFRDGVSRRSFSMLTVSADEHPFMSRFHRPGDEKRSVVVLDDDDWEPWLAAKDEADVRSFLQLFDPDKMRAEADPLPARKSGEATPADVHNER